MNLLQHIANQAERTLAPVLPEASRPVVCATSEKPAAHEAHPPLSGGADGATTQARYGHPTRDTRGFRAEPRLPA